MKNDLVFLTKFHRFSDVGLWCLRALTGASLIYGVIDNIVSAERMDEFVGFMAANCAAPPPKTWWTSRSR